MMILGQESSRPATSNEKTAPAEGNGKSWTRGMLLEIMQKLGDERVVTISCSGLSSFWGSEPDEKPEVKPIPSL